MQSEGVRKGGVIALLTDFGTEDWYVGAMKAVLASEAPGVVVVDLCHGVPPYAVRSGAFVLAAHFSRFPAGTVFLSVVDPTVGSSRPAVAVSTRGRFLVGPDNGLFGPFADHEDLVVAELIPKSTGPGAVSATFEGRDFFAPVAARLARGVAMENLGTLRSGEEHPQALLEPGERWWYREKDVLVTSVLWIDHFGNCITGLPASAIDTNDSWVLELGHRRLEGLHRNFSEVQRGEILMYLGSSETLEIAVREGNAAVEYSIRVGTELRLRPRQPGGNKK